MKQRMVTAIKSTAVTVGQAPQIPTAADAHPHVQQAVRKLREFETKLTAAQDAVAQLLAERDQVQQERHTAGVADLSAGREPALEKFNDRLLVLERKLDQQTDRIAQLQDVLTQQEIITRGVREQVLQELGEQIRAEVRDVFADLRELLRQVEQQNMKLLALHKRATDAGGVAGLPFVFPPDLLRAWLDQAELNSR